MKHDLTTRKYCLLYTSPFSNFRPHLLFYMQMSAQLHYMLIMLVFQTESIKKKKS